MPTRVRAVSAALLALSIAGCATWQRFVYDGLGREKWGKPDAVIALLGLEPGDTVADFGEGYFTLRFAEAVGESGHVFKLDADEGDYHYVKRERRRRGIQNLILQGGGGSFADVVDGVDLVFFCNSYYQFYGQYSERIEMLRALYRPTNRMHARATLAPNGRVAIVEYDGRSWFARMFGHFTPVETIEREMREAGYERVASYELPRQSFQIFRPNDGIRE